MRTQIVVLALVMIVALGTTAVPAMAGTSGGSTGSFGMHNKAPVVGTITLYDGEGSTPASEMTPQTYYNVSIVVSDDNKLHDLTEIQVVIHKSDYSGANSVVDKVTYKWTPGGGWVEYQRPSNPNTWGTISQSECIVPSNLHAVSGTWWVKFMPGKVARESTWSITVTATDEASASDENALTGQSMLWYGEITADDGSFSFGDIALGASNTAISTPADHNIDFTTIVNGNYKLQSQTAAVWTNTTNSEDINLDTDGGTLADGYFALKNNGTNSVGTANNVGTDVGTINDKSNVESGLTEAGNDVPIYLWLSAAAQGIMPYDYSGTYTVTISNN